MERLILYLIGRALLLASGFMVIPFLYSINMGTDQTTGVLGQSILITLISGVLIRSCTARHGDSFSVSGGAAFLFALWTALSIFGALPYYLSGLLGPVDAFMESLSGFTTTGYTCLIDLEDPALILWRSMTQWIGGGMILMFIATIMPAVSGVFGISFSMPVALKTGIISLKRVKNNTRRLSIIYALITLAGILIIRLTGLDVFDAVNFSLVIISTGGCYFYDRSLYDNTWFAMALLIGLMAAGGNVIIYWQAIKRQTTSILKKNLHNTESHIFLAIIGVGGLIMGLHLFAANDYTFLESMKYGFFSVALYAGTISAYPMEVLNWTEFDRMILILAATVGGCIGSLAGGFKILRLIILFKSCVNEMTRTIHPDIIMTIKIDGKIVPPALISRVLGFFFVVIMVIALSILVISAAGLDMQQSMEIALACITSTGAIMFFHTDSATLMALPAAIKLFCCFLMVLGKLDIFALLLLIYNGRQHLLNKRW